jgi:hypothetical protein
MPDPTRTGPQEAPYSTTLRVVVVVSSSLILLIAGALFLLRPDPPAWVPEHPQPWEVSTPTHTGVLVP